MFFMTVGNSSAEKYCIAVEILTDCWMYAYGVHYVHVHVGRQNKCTRSPLHQHCHVVKSSLTTCIPYVEWTWSGRVWTYCTETNLVGTEPLIFLGQKYTCKHYFRKGLWIWFPKMFIINRYTCSEKIYRNLYRKICDVLFETPLQIVQMTSLELKHWSCWVETWSK